MRARLFHSLPFSLDLPPFPPSPNRYRTNCPTGLRYCVFFPEATRSPNRPRSLFFFFQTMCVDGERHVNCFSNSPPSSSWRLTSRCAAPTPPHSICPFLFFPLSFFVLRSPIFLARWISGGGREEVGLPPLAYVFPFFPPTS